MLKRFTSHTLMAVAEGALIALLVVGLLAGTAFAGKGGSGKGGRTADSGSIALAPLVVDNNGNGEPDRGDVVTFDIATSDPAPFVQVECYQSGSLVLMGRKGYFDGSLDSNWNFGLSSGAWTSGAADCTGSLVAYSKRGWKTYASTSFHVDG
jgi:hypothetical protein